jgi:hypothetical protein
MSAIVMVSVLILPIVYFLGLSHYTQDLVASFGFGFGATVTLTLLFVPKIMVQYHLDSARLSAMVAVENLLSSKKKIQNAGGPAGAEAAQADHEAELMLKGKSKEEKLFVCQEQLRRWQVLLLAQQRAALNSNSTSSNHHSSSGVGSSSPVRANGSMLPSFIEAEPEFNLGCNELFSMNPEVAASIDIGSFTGSTLTAQDRISAYGHDDLVVQEMA